MTFWQRLCELFRRGDYVEPETARRIRAQADDAAELEVSLGAPQPRKRERDSRQRSAPSAYRQEWRADR